MGMRMTETCWAVFKRRAINLREWCIWLVDLFEKNSIDTIGNWTCYFPACSAVPQPTAPPAACPGKLKYLEKYSVQLPLHPPQVPYGLTWQWTRTSCVQARPATEHSRRYRLHTESWSYAERPRWPYSTPISTNAGLQSQWVSPARQDNKQSAHT